MKDAHCYQGVRGIELADDGAFEPDVGGLVFKDVGASAQGRRIEEELQFRHGIGRAHGVAIEFAHRAGIVTAVPADMEGVHEPSWAAKIAQKNRAAGFCEARHFGE